MTPKPYVGITGPTTPEEVEAIKKEFKQSGFSMNSPHIPMLGFLISYKTLNHQPTQNKRYPKITQLNSLLRHSQGIFPTIHYNSRKPELAEQITQLFEERYESELCRAVQLNIPFPEIQELEKIKNTFPKLQIIFQANQGVLNHVNAIDKIQDYNGLIDYLLIDPSGGKGQEFNLDSSINFYDNIKGRIPDLTIGFAGGFKGENVESRVKEIITRLKTDDFSIDAEGGLRDKLSQKYGDDLFNLQKVRDYLQNASKILR